MAQSDPSSAIKDRPHITYLSATMCSIQDILAKKRDGKELTREDVDYMITGAVEGHVREAQIGALLMACHLKGLTDDEVELMMRAMMFSGELLLWPKEWEGNMASLQSTGTTGNKAKLILAPAMAACGLKFPIMSSRGGDILGGVLNKMSTIPGFNGSNKSLEDIQKLLTNVGCCVVEQPSQVAPAERIIQDIAGLVTVGRNNAFKEACMIARVGALKLRAIVMEIPFGPGEAITTREDAEKMANTLIRLSKIMNIKCHLVMTRVDYPVGNVVGQSLEVAEAIKCLNGSGSKDLHHVVCRLGGHILYEAKLVDDIKKGEEMVAKKLKDGSAKKKFGELLQAQGVSKADVKILLKHKKDDDHVWSVLPISNFFTHASAQEPGYVHGIDVTVCNEIMFELSEPIFQGQKNSKKGAGGGGIQILVRVGDFLNKGDLWAKVHHNSKLTQDQANRLLRAITLKLEAPTAELVIEVIKVPTEKEPVTVL